MFDTRERILDQLGAGEDGQAEFMLLRFDDQGGTSTDVEELAGELVGFVARLMPSSPDTGPSTGTVAAYDLAVVDEAIVNAVARSTSCSATSFG